MCMVYIAYVKIMVTGKNRISEYRIHVYAGHLSFLGKWSFFGCFSVTKPLVLPRVNKNTLVYKTSYYNRNMVGAFIMVSIPYR